MNEVKVFIQTRENGIIPGILDRAKPVRVEAWYVGRYKKAIVCIRESDKMHDKDRANGFVSFEVSTGKIISRDNNFEQLKTRSFELITKNYQMLEPMIDRLAPLYGIGRFMIGGHEILGNTLIEKKVYNLCMKRTNGRYKKIADKILS